LKVVTYRVREDREIMKELWTFALENPALLVVPAIGFVLSLVVVRIKTRYVNEGVLFCWSPGARREGEGTSTAEDEEMSGENHIDLAVALKTIHELAVAEAYLEYEYRYEIGRLLTRANGMQAEIDLLKKELERCRAMLDRAK